MKVLYEVRLTQVDNGGLIVNVGCKTLVFTSVAIAMQELSLFFENPDATIDEYAKRYGWAREAPAPASPPTIGYEEARDARPREGSIVGLGGAPREQTRRG
jgi:hypothetical protein